MVTAPMTNPGVVELPGAGQSLNQPKLPPIVVMVKKDGSSEMDGKTMQRDELLSLVKTQLAKSPERSVVIAGDKNVKYEDVIGVMDVLKTNKVDKVGLLLKPL